MAFTLPITVHPEDADQLGHVNNVVWLRWVQDAAMAHWLALASPAQVETIPWVVRRHELDYLAPAFPGDRLEATTWVGDTEGATSVRHVIIRNAMGKELLRARTVWIPLDKVSGRPRRIDAELRALLARGREGIERGER